MPEIDIQISEQQVAELKRALLVGRNVDRAMSSAINKTVRKARTMVSRQLAEILTVKRTNIRRRIEIVETARTTHPSATLRIMGRSIGLINFEHRDTHSHGVDYRFYREQEFENEPHAFEAVGNSGNRHIFERVVRNGKRAGRLPIKSLKGLSLLQVYSSRPELLEEAKRFIDADIRRQLSSQIDRFLAR